MARKRGAKQKTLQVHKSLGQDWITPVFAGRCTFPSCTATRTLHKRLAEQDETETQPFALSWSVTILSTGWEVCKKKPFRILRQALTMTCCQQPSIVQYKWPYRFCGAVSNQGAVSLVCLVCGISGGKKKFQLQ